MWIIQSMLVFFIGKTLFLANIFSGWLKFSRTLQPLFCFFKVFWSNSAKIIFFLCNHGIHWCSNSPIQTQIGLQFRRFTSNKTCSMPLLQSTLDDNSLKKLICYVKIVIYCVYVIKTDMFRFLSGQDNFESIN